MLRDANISPGFGAIGPRVTTVRLGRSGSGCSYTSLPDSRESRVDSPTLFEVLNLRCWVPLRRSESTKSTRAERRAKEMARFAAQVDFPSAAKLLVSNIRRGSRSTADNRSEDRSVRKPSAMID